MGLVSEYLHDLVAAQLQEPRVVVWFDPEGHYRAFLDELALSETTVAVYEGSFFALRREIDPLLRADTPPRLLVYVPLAEEATDHALIELTAAGVALAPGAQDPACNTRLA